MKCLVTETLSGEKDGSMAVCVMTLQTTEELDASDTLFMRIGKYGFRVGNSSL